MNPNFIQHNNYQLSSNSLQIDLDVVIFQNHIMFIFFLPRLNAPSQFFVVKQESY
jgi:hypothetical protein